MVTADDQVLGVVLALALLVGALVTFFETHHH